MHNDADEALDTVINFQGQNILIFHSSFYKCDFTPYKSSMINSFKHKGLKLLWEEEKTNKLPADHIRHIEMMLAVIDSAQEVPEDLVLFKTGISIRFQAI